jgi:hypothetical protein
MLNNQQIFEAWLAGKLTTAECEQQLQSDSEWYGRFLTAQQLQRHAKVPAYAPVPDIDTSQMFRQQWGGRPAKTAWWPKLSVGMSAMALIISISPLQLQVQDGALALTWKENNSLQQQQEMTTMLASFQQEQQQYLQQQLQNQQQQQATQLVLLKDYLTENEQKARSSDMIELVEYLNQQRQADWQYWQDNVQPTQARQDYGSSYLPNRTQIDPKRSN